ncbi:MAG: GNAT family N-acetyltransferase, partial [Planctomycetaceae bacterium]|nr:GNAT family N-acetyltransferase [Planctomycetaceae bacterium]
GGAVVGVLIAQLRPDGLVSIWYPATKENRPLEPLLSHLDNYTLSRNAPAIILIADKDQFIDEKLIFANGFEYISDMLMLFSAVPPTNNIVPTNNSKRLRFIPVDQTNNYREPLINLMAQTHVNTKDFPKLLALSPVNNILDEYLRNPFFRSDIWFFVQKLHAADNNKNIGVLLLNDIPPDNIELTYMGLINNERGQGYSHEIIQFAKQITANNGRKLLSTVVDDQNTNALHAYIKQGFTAWDRKKVYAKIFHNH